MVANAPLLGFSVATIAENLPLNGNTVAGRMSFSNDLNMFCEHYRNTIDQFEGETNKINMQEICNNKEFKTARKPFRTQTATSAKRGPASQKEFDNLSAIEKAEDPETPIIKFKTNGNDPWNLLLKDKIPEKPSDNEVSELSLTSKSICSFLKLQIS